MTTAISAAAVCVSLAVLVQQRRRERRRARRGSFEDEEDLAAEEPSSPLLSKSEAHEARLDTLVLERGRADSAEYRVHALEVPKASSEGFAPTKELSLWHDVPLVAEEGGAPERSVPTFNFVCEIPKCTRKKFEVATNEGATQGSTRVRRWPTSKAHISVAFHSFWLIFGRVIISRNGVEAWTLVLERARAEQPS